MAVPSFFTMTAFNWKSLWKKGRNSEEKNSASSDKSEREREIYMDQLMLDSSLTKVRFEGIGLVEVEEESPPVAVVAVEGTSGNHHGVMYAKHRNKTDRFG